MNLYIMEDFKKNNFIDVIRKNKIEVKKKIKK